MSKRRSGRSKTEVDYAKLTTGCSDDEDDFVTMPAKKKKLVEISPKCAIPEKPRTIICEKYVYIKDQPNSRFAVKENDFSPRTPSNAVSQRTVIALDNSPSRHCDRQNLDRQIQPVNVTLTDLLAPIVTGDNLFDGRTVGPAGDINKLVFKQLELQIGETTKRSLDVGEKLITSPAEVTVRVAQTPASLVERIQPLTKEKTRNAETNRTAEKSTERRGTPSRATRPVDPKPQLARNTKENSSTTKEKVVPLTVIASFPECVSNSTIAIKVDAASPAAPVSGSSGIRPLVAATKWKAPGPANYSKSGSSPSGPGLGLRLGLSRNVKIKPLHSNVQAKH